MRNYLSLNSDFEFGKYNGFKINGEEIKLLGAYLFEPSYIDWILRCTDKYLIDIEDAKAIKVIDIINYDANEAGVVYEIIEGFIKYLNWEELKYVGFKFFTFSDEAILKNDLKITQSGYKKKKRSFYYDESTPPYIGFANERINTDLFEIKCLEYKVTSKNYTYIIFNLDNTNMIIQQLPAIKDCKFASLAYSNWKYQDEELKVLCLNNEIRKGKLGNGFLQIF